MHLGGRATVSLAANIAPYSRKTRLANGSASTLQTSEVNGLPRVIESRWESRASRYSRSVTAGGGCPHVALTDIIVSTIVTNDPLRLRPTFIPSFSSQDAYELGRRSRDIRS